jgi:ribosomal-protein-alanine N-acetyltransferase
MTRLPWPLSGECVALRPFSQSDINADYLAWLNDPITMQYSNQRFYQHDFASATRYLASFNGSDNLFVAIDDKVGLRLGTMTAYVSPQHGTADLGILIGERKVWGQGLGLDAWRTLMKCLFQRGIRKVTGGTVDCNAAMLAIFSKSDMQPEGRRKRQEIIEGKEHDILLYARFAND